MRIDFNKIETKRTKKYVDENGKKRQKTKTFYQTLNPFNKNKFGYPKSKDEIWYEINEEADAWMNSKELK